MKSAYKSAEGERAVRERYIKFLQYWPVPNRQLRIPTREGETFVVECGPEGAPALILLHGASGNAAMWMADVAAWAEHFRVYAVDVIGDAGLSAPSRPPLVSAAHALWLDDVMHGLSLERLFSGRLQWRLAGTGLCHAAARARRKPGCVLPRRPGPSEEYSHQGASFPAVGQLGRTQGERNDYWPNAGQRVQGTPALRGFHSAHLPAFAPAHREASGPDRRSAQAANHAGAGDPRRPGCNLRFPSHPAPSGANSAPRRDSIHSRRRSLHSPSDPGGPRFSGTGSTRRLTGRLFRGTILHDT